MILAMALALRSSPLALASCWRVCRCCSLKSGQFVSSLGCTSWWTQSVLLVLPLANNGAALLCSDISPGLLGMGGTGFWGLWEEWFCGYMSILQDVGGLSNSRLVDYTIFDWASLLLAALLLSTKHDFSHLVIQAVDSDLFLRGWKVL
jgi:hypothetical protein